MSACLSFRKLRELLSKHSYTLVSTYTVGTQIRFMECRTPKTQKIFLIHIPEKYSLEGDFFVRLQLSPLDFDTVSNNYIDRLQEVKQNIDGDLLFISNILVTLCKSETLDPNPRRGLGGDPNIQCYSIVTGSYDDEADYGESEPEAEKSEVEEVIVKKMARINKLVDGGETLVPNPQAGFANKDEPKTNSVDADVKSTPIEDVIGTSPTIVELEFEDVEITPLLEDDSYLIEGEDGGNLTETASDTEGAETASDQGRTEGSASASSIGMIYYCIDLGLFYKTLQSIEQDIEDVYEALDEGGYSLIDSKLEEISNIIENIQTVSKALVEKAKQEDVSLRTKKESLLTVVNQAENIKLRTVGRASRYGDVLSEIEGIHLQAKELIRSVNADMIRNRETTIDKLDTILASLEEIIRN